MGTGNRTRSKELSTLTKPSLSLSSVDINTPTKNVHTILGHTISFNKILKYHNIKLTLQNKYSIKNLLNSYTKNYIPLKKCQAINRSITKIVRYKKDENKSGNQVKRAL